MLNIKIRQALDPEDAAETACCLCGIDFVPGSVYAQVTRIEIDPGMVPKVCPTCLSYLNARNPGGGFPSVAQLAAVAQRYPDPVWPSIEHVLYLENEEPERARREYASSWLEESGRG